MNGYYDRKAQQSLDLLGKPQPPPPAAALVPVRSVPYSLQHARMKPEGKALSLVFYSSMGAYMAYCCTVSLYTWPGVAALLALLSLVYWMERRA